MSSFQLLEDRPGLGNKGDFIGLEVNMRPPWWLYARYDELG